MHLSLRHKDGKPEELKDIHQLVVLTDSGEPIVVLKHPTEGSPAIFQLVRSDPDFESYMLQLGYIKSDAPDKIQL